MAVRSIGGYDPNTGWPPDDSTGLPWQDDTVLPGQFKGGGAGFGPGGFQGAPRLTANPAGPPPGLSLSQQGGGAAPDGGTFDPRPNPAFRGPRWGGGPPPGFDMNTPDEVIPPENSTIPNNKSVGPFTGGSATDAELLPEAGDPRTLIPPNWVRRNTPIGRAIDVGRRILSPDETAAPTGVELPRTLGRSPSGPSFPDQTPKFPTPTGYPPVATPFTQPDHPSTMRYPMWPTPPAPVAGPTGDPRGEPNNFPNSPNPIGAPVPTPIGSPAPAIPPRRAVPRAAGPAAQRQQPDLGHYGPFVSVPRPNADVAGGARGRQSVPYTTALDLSRLFQPRQQ